jgi:hypothetical protein
MLAKISEVTNILLQVRRNVVLTADIYLKHHESLKIDHVLLGSTILDANMEVNECFLPVVVLFVQYGSLLVAFFGGGPWTKSCRDFL